MLSSEEKLKNYCNNVVLHGPFAGLYVEPSSHWWGGDIMAKWLGTYEEPIHLAIASELQKKHDMFINIGCGDGYYGAGVALKNPDSQIIFADLAETCEGLVNNICGKNGVSNFIFSRDSSAGNISKFLKAAKSPWMLMDIEGAEMDLLDPQKIPELQSTVIIVEMHDFCRAGSTTGMTARFDKTHYVLNISDTLKRNLVMLPSNIDLNEPEREKIITEGRPTRMNWLYMLPR